MEVTMKSRQKTSLRKHQHIEETTRRRSALERLESQLKEGTKTAKKSFEKVKLEKSDISRIKSEISKLKTKLHIK